MRRGLYTHPQTDAEAAGARRRRVSNCRRMIEHTHPEDHLFHADWLSNRAYSGDRASSVRRLRKLGY